MACNGYSIQLVAKRCGMTTHTLRYYERIGLIRPITRGTNGHRCYSPADERWLRFLHFMRVTHMPIRDLQRYAMLRLEGQTGSPEQHRLLEGHRAALKGQIANLEKACELLSHYLEKLGMSMQTPQTTPLVSGKPQGIPESTEAARGYCNS